MFVCFLLLFVSYLCPIVIFASLILAGNIQIGSFFVIASCFFYLVFGTVYFLQICHLRFRLDGFGESIEQGELVCQVFF
jgi:uncharacterized membrane protein YedE/YeeE